MSISDTLYRVNDGIVFTAQQNKNISVKKEPGFGLAVVSLSTEQKHRNSLFRAIQASVNDWRTIIQHRYDSTKSIQLQKGSGDSDSLETDDNLIEDSIIIQKYQYLGEKIEKDIETIKTKLKNNYYLMALTDSEQRVQGLTSLYIKTNVLFVNVLMTAPWNVPLYSENAEEHKKLVVKGVGTTLMRQIYELAKIKDKPLIELIPIPSSLSFYQNHLKMTLSARKDKVSYAVSDDSMPEVLEVSSGNLLAGHSASTASFGISH